MSLKLESGLFNLDFTDYHAILGIPVDADPKDIRKQYLKLARRLHPDSCAKESEADRTRASEFLSKLVNPAYEKLSQEKNFTEYLLLLKIKGQQALRQQETVVLSSDEARKLAGNSGEIDAAYRLAVKALAEKQYNHLEQTLDLTGRISELNLVYLMRKAGKGDFPTPSSINQRSTTSGAASTSPPPAAAAPPNPKAPATKEAILASYLRRAQEFEGKQDYTNAIKELRDALQMAPNYAAAHSRLGVVYLKANQTTMAKIHFRKALEINPEDAVAQEGMRRVDPSGAAAAAKGGKADPKAGKPDPKAGKPAQGKTAQPGKPNPKGGKPESGGGLFGLFGGKKK